MYSVRSTPQQRTTSPIHPVLALPDHQAVEYFRATPPVHIVDMRMNFWRADAMVGSRNDSGVPGWTQDCMHVCIHSDALQQTFPRQLLTQMRVAQIAQGEREAQRRLGWESKGGERESGARSKGGEAKGEGGIEGVVCSGGGRTATGGRGIAMGEERQGSLRPSCSQAWRAGICYSTC